MTDLIIKSNVAKLYIVYIDISILYCMYIYKYYMYIHMYVYAFWLTRPLSTPYGDVTTEIHHINLSNSVCALMNLECFFLFVEIKFHCGRSNELNLWINCIYLYAICTYMYVFKLVILKKCLYIHNILYNTYICL